MKRVILSAVCALTIGALSAQSSDFEEKVEYNGEKYAVETNSFWNNWFVSVGGGANIYFGDHDKQAKFADRLGPALDIAVGKWFTPGIGVRLEYSGLYIKGATQNGSHSTGVDVPGKGGTGFWLKKQKFSFANYHADVLFNLHNLFGGYKENRVWTCSPYLGVGWAMVERAPIADEASVNLGVFNSFRVSSAIDINLDIRGMYINDRFDGEGGGRFGEGMWGATVGITYKFKQRGWDRSKTITRYNNSAVNDLRRQLAAANDENEKLRGELSAARNIKTTETIIKKMAVGNLIVFEIGKSELSKEARANLGMFADVVKSADPNAVYTITGYADKGTGSNEMNEKLSKARAEAVYNCLVSEFGVSEKQLRMEYKGGVDNMFYDDPRMSRAVITGSAQ